MMTNHKVPALEARFREASKLLARHDLNVVGYWVPDVDPAWDNTDQTVRERLRLSVGGRQIRIHLSNEYGSAPVLVGQGDHTRAARIDGGAVSESSILVSVVLVPADASHRLIVAFGDSIIDGDGSTVDADHNWPSDLIRRLQKTPEGSKLAVVNAGIAGNRLLSDGVSISFGFGASGLARFDRDALLLPGVTHIVLLEGINDIGFPGAKLRGEYLADPADALSVEDLMGAYRQLISRAHAHGVKLIGATMTPFEGAAIPGYYSESKEGVRKS